MSAISGVNAAALLILQQTNATSSVTDDQSASDYLVAVANGDGKKIGMSAQPGQAQSRISEAMFSVENVNINKMKLDLIERAGEKLGFDKSDFASEADFARQMRKKVIVMHASGADQTIAKIEKELGLDKLGVSLLEVVSSERNPDTDDAVTQALKEREGMKGKEEIEKQEKESEALFSSSLGPNEIGLYGPASY